MNGARAGLENAHRHALIITSLRIKRAPPSLVAPSLWSIPCAPRPPRAPPGICGGCAPFWRWAPFRRPRRGGRAGWGIWRGVARSRGVVAVVALLGENHSCVWSPLVSFSLDARSLPKGEKCRQCVRDARKILENSRLYLRACGCNSNGGVCTYAALLCRIVHLMYVFYYVVICGMIFFLLDCLFTASVVCIVNWLLCFINSMVRCRMCAFALFFIYVRK